MTSCVNELTIKEIFFLIDLVINYYLGSIHVTFNSYT